MIARSLADALFDPHCPSDCVPAGSSMPPASISIGGRSFVSARSKQTVSPRSRGRRDEIPTVFDGLSLDKVDERPRSLSTRPSIGKGRKIVSSGGRESDEEISVAAFWIEPALRAAEPKTSGRVTPKRRQSAARASRLSAMSDCMVVSRLSAPITPSGMAHAARDRRVLGGPSPSRTDASKGR